MRQVTFTVPGVAVSQGSKRPFQNKHTGKISVVESNAKTLKPWRREIRDAAVEAIDGVGFGDDPVELKVRFLFNRPLSHYGTGRNAGVLKASASAFPAVRPDLDKLVRAVLDALTEAGVWREDSRVVSLRVEKRYTEWSPECQIQVREAVE